MKQNKKTSNSILSNFTYATKIYHKSIGKSYHVHDMIAIVLGVITPFASMAFPSAVIALLNSSQPTERIFLLIVGYAVLLKGLSLGMAYMNDLQFTNYFLGRGSSGWVMRQHILSMDYEALERKEGQDKLYGANECLYYGNEYGIEAFLRQFPLLFMNLIGFLLYSIIVFRINLWLFVYMLVTALILGGMNLWLGSNAEKTKKKEFDLFGKRKKALEETMDVKARGDIILYQMKDWLSQKLYVIRDEYKAFHSKNFRMQQIGDIATHIFNLLRDGIVYYLLIQQMIKGQISVSELLLFTGVIAGYSVWMNQLLKALQEMSFNSNTITRFRDFMEYGKVQTPDQCTTIQKQKPHEIRLEDVSYRYDGIDKDVLSHINLTVHAGEKIALVGANGAGKTTLVKLMTGLYTPTSGKIYLDGVDVTKISKTEYFNEFSAVFQDTKVFACSIAQNVACKMQPDPKRVLDCLNMAGLSDKINSLPNGIDTIMTQNLSPDGVEFSGGETQKLMLARALYEIAPVLILDEPTAALDPIAESNMYETYSKFAQNKTSIFISHRLSSTRFCDSVCFISNGTITEQGTHEQLVKNGQEYAKMYAIQAQYYQDENKAKLGEVSYEG